jgi:hypothetical protein
VTAIGGDPSGNHFETITKHAYSTLGFKNLTAGMERIKNSQLGPTISMMQSIQAVNRSTNFEER